MRAAAVIMLMAGGVQAQLIEKSVNVPSHNYAAYTIDDPGAYLRLTLIPDDGVTIKTAGIRKRDESDTVMWRRQSMLLYEMDPLSPGCLAPSSREWLWITGQYTRVLSGPGGAGKAQDPWFNVRVPGVDIDLDDWTTAAGEALEESVGGLLGWCTNITCADGHLKHVLLRKVEPKERFPDSSTWVVLDSQPRNLRVFTSSTGGKNSVLKLPAKLKQSQLPMDLWIQGTNASQALRDTILIVTNIPPPGEIDCGQDIIAFTVLKVESIKIARPWDAGWGDLHWGSVILLNDDLRVKATVVPSLSSLDSIVGVFSAKIRKLSIDASGNTNVLSAFEIPITKENSVLFKQDEIRVTIPASDVAGNNLVSYAEDGNSEFCSGDASNLSSVPTGSSNRNDSDAFDSGQNAVGHTRRGMARSPGTLTALPPESELSQTFVKAAGVLYFDVDIAGTKSQIRQIQEQADAFYYSGHGIHDGGYLAVYEPLDASLGSCLYANDVAAYWSDIDVAIVAGCSVLDIGDYNFNFPGGNTSPGKAWAVNGSDWYLGYNAWAPSDSRNGNQWTTASIIQSWQTKVNAGCNVETAWKEANLGAVDPDGYCHGRNACVIHAVGAGSGTYSYFDIDLFGNLTWRVVPESDWP